MVISVLNPLTGRTDEEIIPATAKQVHDIALRARAASASWASLTVEQRGKHIVALRDAIEKNQNEILDALAVDTARKDNMEMAYVLRLLSMWAAESEEILRPTEVQSTTPGYKLRNLFRPYQVCGFLVPWNFPLCLALVDAVPALMAGCTVLIKPSELTPRFVAPLQKIIKALEGPLGAGAIEFVLGGPETGAAVIDNVDLCCFTGGVSIGRIIAKHCAERMIPLYLELGGKDPAIVDSSANLESAAHSVVLGALINTGQTCFAIERVYVHEDIHDVFLSSLVDKTKEMSEQGMLNPLISPRQGVVIEKHIQDAISKGADVKLGGKVYKDENGGVRVQGTVLSGVNHDMLVMKEETFGPVIPVMKFSTVEEAIELSNDSEYGLSGAVFCNPREKAVQIADRLNVGFVGVNETCPLLHEPRAANNPFRLSGVGTASRTGRQSILRFVRNCAQLIKDDPAEVSTSWGA